MPIKRPLRDRGDTIVEVLISIALIGTILAGAYAAAYRSSRDIQDSQEHETAIVLGQSQLEILDSQAATAGFANNNHFCFTATDTVSTTACSGLGSSNLYSVDISKDGTPPANNLQAYEIKVTWQRLAGGGDSVAMFYQPPGVVPIPYTETPVTPPPACQYIYGQNHISNGDFSISPGNNPTSEAAAAGFSSQLPNRGANLYPDDTGVYGSTNAQTEYKGGFAIEGPTPSTPAYGGTYDGEILVDPTGVSNFDPAFNSNATPIVYGIGFPGYTSAGNCITAAASKYYFYSNPVQSISQSRCGPGFCSSYGDYDGEDNPIWQETVNGLLGGKTYRFTGYFLNLFNRATQPGEKDPIITLQAQGDPTPIVNRLDVPYVAGNRAAPGWNGWIQISGTATTAANQTSMTLQIIDSADSIQNDDFGMTGLSMEQECAGDLGVCQ